MRCVDHGGEEKIWSCARAIYRLCGVENTNFGTATLAERGNVCVGAERPRVLAQQDCAV
jgi:hypothetical protein